ncbi:MAG TPA: hypothetical protein VFQ80_05655 [Thermomicrobiales bacterium]|nr:hypothetical protein [Thermomicrobiales bacterium]
MREFTANHDDVFDEPVFLRDPDDAGDDDETIDQVLRLVADHHREIGALIGKRGFSPTLAELRQSPLGRDLRLLAGAAGGDASPATVDAAAARLRSLLLRPLASDDVHVPVWFWGTAIGRLTARAERNARGAAAFVSLPEASARLDVDRATLQAWIAEGALPIVPDEQGQPLIPCSAVERRRLIRLEFSVDDLARPDDVVLAERRLAS